MVEERPVDQAVRRSSDGSLPLKPPRGKEQSSPAPSEHSSGGQDDPGPVHVNLRQPDIEEAPDRERDALDDIIDEAKATIDLVS